MQLVPADLGDLPFILALERKPEFHGFVGSWEPAVHQGAFADPDLRYHIAGARARFLILGGLSTEDRSIDVEGLIIAESRPRPGATARDAVRRVWPVRCFPGPETGTARTARATPTRSAARSRARCGPGAATASRRPRSD